MESNELKRLADKFWAGESSSEEEEILRERFIYGNVPDEHRELADYLSFMQGERQSKRLDESFDQKVMDQVKGQRSTSLRTNFMRIAAGLTLLIGLGIGIKTISGPEEVIASADYIDTYDDPEVAYREVKKALFMMSKGMNEGVEATESLGEFHRAQSELEKNIKAK